MNHTKKRPFSPADVVEEGPLKRVKVEETKDLELLSLDEVFNLLINLGMPVPMKTIQEFNINGDLLACCASQSDLTELGVSAANAKLTLLLKKITRFAKEGVPQALISPPSIANPVPQKAPFKLQTVPGIIIANGGSPVSTLSADSIDEEVNTTMQESFAETRISQADAKRKSKKVSSNKQRALSRPMNRAPLADAVVNAKSVQLPETKGRALSSYHSSQVEEVLVKPAVTACIKLVPPNQLSTTALVAPLVETGEVHYSNGDVYQGTLVGGLRQGYGVMSYAMDDSVYSGEWSADNRQGEGTLTFKYRRQQYQGQWCDNTFNGWGELTFESGTVFKGQFKDGKLLGYGVMKYANGDVYEGYYLDSSREGVFECRYSNGAHYQGNYNHNRKDGEGEYVTAKADRYRGTFERGVMRGTGTATFADGREYNGNFENRLFDGWGRLYDPCRNDEYCGEFAGGQKEGKGVLKQGNGVIYKGEWKADKRHGFGRMSNENGVMFEGMFFNDRFCRGK